MVAKTEILSEPVPLNAWVNDNNPPIEQAYDKGFWDYVEMVRRLVDKFDGTNERVVGTYVVRTPPPEEELQMPAIAFDVGRASVAVRFDFGADASWPREWTVSIKRPSPYLGPVFGLFDQDGEVSSRMTTGFGETWTLPPLRKSPAAFSCELVDEWDVAMLVRLVSYEV
jgi:hypothetical protein